MSDGGPEVFDKTDDPASIRQRVYGEAIVRDRGNSEGTGQIFVGPARDRTADDRPTTANGVTLRWATGESMVRFTLDEVQAAALRDALDQRVE